MIYAICTQSTEEAVRSVVGDADMLQVVKDCRVSLTEAQRLPVDTLLVDVATVRSTDDVLAYKTTTVRQPPRIIVLAPQAEPGDKTIGQLVGYGIYDVVSNLDRLTGVLDAPPATIVQAARWIVRDQKKDRGNAERQGGGARAAVIFASVAAVGTGARTATGRLARSLVSLVGGIKGRARFRHHRQVSAAEAKTEIQDDVTEAADVEAVAGGAAEPNSTSFATPDHELPTEPIVATVAAAPDSPPSTQVHVDIRRVTRAIAREAWDLSRALLLLAWRVAVLAVQLIPYAMAAEAAVLMGYLPGWAGDPAHGYWLIAHAVDPRTPTMHAMWHYLSHVSATIGRGGGKA